MLSVDIDIITLYFYIFSDDLSTKNYIFSDDQSYKNYIFPDECLLSLIERGLAQTSANPLCTYLTASTQGLYLGFEGGYLAFGVGFFLTLDGDNLFGGAVDELLIAEFLHHGGEEAFGILQLFVELFQFGLLVDVEAATLSVTDSILPTLPSLQMMPLNMAGQWPLI